MFVMKHLIIVAVLESLVISSAVLRFALPGAGVDLSAPPQLAWFIVTLVLSSTAVSHFVVRSSLLSKKIKEGENVNDERGHILSVSIAIVAGAGLLSLAGPSSFVQLFG